MKSRDILKLFCIMVAIITITTGILVAIGLWLIGDPPGAGGTGSGLATNASRDDFRLEGIIVCAASIILGLAPYLLVRLGSKKL